MYAATNARSVSVSQPRFEEFLAGKHHLVAFKIRVAVALVDCGILERERRAQAEVFEQTNHGCYLDTGNIPVVRRFVDAANTLRNIRTLDLENAYLCLNLVIKPGPADACLDCLAALGFCIQDTCIHAGPGHGVVVLTPVGIDVGSGLGSIDDVPDSTNAGADEVLIAAER